MVPASAVAGQARRPPARKKVWGIIRRVGVGCLEILASWNLIIVAIFLKASSKLKGD